MSHHSSLGTSHNLSWRVGNGGGGGGGVGEIGGPSIFFGWNMGALKCQKMTLGGGGSSSFTQSPILCNTKTI